VSISPTIGIDDFLRVDIRVGTIVEAAPNEAARKPSYRLIVDFGPELGRKQSSAQLPSNYTVDELVGRQVAAVINFPPRQIAKVISEVLVLGFPDAAGEVVLVSVDRPVPNGGRLY
jgi:tRNA-binding protein